MLSSRRTMLFAVALSWLPAAASSQIRISSTSESAVELTDGSGITIRIEGAGFDRIRSVVVARDAAGRDVISEITGGYRGTASAGNLTLALGGVASPGTYFLFVTDGRELAPVPVELTVAGANERPIVSRVLVDESVEPGQTFKVTVDAQDDRGLRGIEWEFVGRPGGETLPPEHAGYEQTSATLTFELTTDQIGKHVLAITVLDLDGLRSDVFEAAVTVLATAPPSEAPTILSPSPMVGTVVSFESGTPFSFEWSAVDGAEEYSWQLADDFDLIGGTIQTVSSLSASILRTPIDGEDYWFRVRAVNVGGAGPFSEAMSIYVRGQPIEQPTILSSFPATQGQPDVEAGESFTFEWTPVPNATEYEYCTGHNNDGDGVGSPVCGPATTVVASSVSLAFAGAPTRYYFRVRAKRNTRRGPYSDYASIVVAAPVLTWEVLQGPGGAEAPMISTLSPWGFDADPASLLGSEFRPDDLALTVTWDHVVGAEGAARATGFLQDPYEVCYNRDNSDTCLSSEREDLGHHHTVEVPYGSGCEHYIKIRIIREDGTFGPYSDTVHATTGGC